LPSSISSSTTRAAATRQYFVNVSDSNTVDELAEVRSLKLAMIAGRYNVSDLPDLYFFRDKYCSTLGQVNYVRTCERCETQIKIIIYSQCFFINS